MTDFRLVQGLHAYSGGTVPDFHRIHYPPVELSPLPQALKHIILLYSRLIILTPKVNVNIYDEMVKNDLFSNAAKNARKFFSYNFRHIVGAVFAKGEAYTSANIIGRNPHCLQHMGRLDAGGVAGGAH